MLLHPFHAVLHGAFFHFLQGFFVIGFHFVCRCFCCFFIVNQFPHRENGHSVEFIHGTLALGIHGTDAVDFVIPKLNTHRILCCQGVYVQNPPADSKLSGAFHQFCPFITHKHQLFCQVSQFPHFPHMQCQEERSKYFFFGVSVQKCFHRCHNERTFPFQQFFHHQKTLSVHFHAVNIGAVKEDIFCRIIHACLCEELHILQNLFCPHFTMGQNHHGALQMFLHPIKEMIFFHVNDPCGKHRGMSSPDFIQ